MREIETDIASLARAVRDGQASAEAVTRQALARIEATDRSLGAFLEVDPDLAISQAREVDRALRTAATPYALAGVPIGVKDCFVTKGLRTTCGSRMLERYVPPYDATAVGKLRDAGAVVVGKLNMDEFCMGSSNESSAFWPVRNPRDLQRVPGGSSGGAAAAVAAGIVPGALGSDTGGSVRQPASFCGVVGLKPTYGRISRYGLIAFASSLDCPGPIARTVRDAAILYAAVAGPDPRDSTSRCEPVGDVLEGLGGGIGNLTMGVVSEHVGPGTASEVVEAIERAVDAVAAKAGRVLRVSLPRSSSAISIYHVVADAEASSNLARFDGVRYGLREEERTLRETYEATRRAGFGPEVKRRIMLGTYVLRAGYYAALYERAMKARTLVRQDFSRAFDSVDVIVGPTTPTTAFRLGERTDDPLAMYQADALTIPASLAGLPAISIPCGTDRAGLPIGLQIVGPALREDLVLRVAACFEEAAGRAWQPGGSA